MKRRSFFGILLAPFGLLAVPLFKKQKKRPRLQDVDWGEAPIWAAIREQKERLRRRAWRVRCERDKASFWAKIDSIDKKYNPPGPNHRPGVVISEPASVEIRRNIKYCRSIGRVHPCDPRRHT